MMRIADIRVHLCNAAWRNWVFIEVETDSGLVGVGEATVEGRELTMEGHFADLRRVVVGMDPFNIRDLRQKLTRDPFWVGGFVGGSGLAGIEMACWDIIGKTLSVPVWQLFGGRLRDRVSTYANGWYFGASEVQEWVRRANEVVDHGYRALKFDPFGRAGHAITGDELDNALEIVQALRASLGPRVDLLIEGHGRFGVESAMRVVRGLQQFDVLFFEEPTAPGEASSILKVAEASGVPIAAGERCYSVKDARLLLDRGAVSVMQPDVIHAGGIVETVEIGTYAAAHGISLAPHNPNGGVATAATLVVDTVSPNFLVQEMLAPWDVPWRHEVVRGCPDVVDGFLAVPTAPGLGVELDLEAIKKHPFEPVDPSFWSGESVMETVDLKPPVSQASEKG